MVRPRSATKDVEWQVFYKMEATDVLRAVHAPTGAATRTSDSAAEN
jgi:hypothetical protein